MTEPEYHVASFVVHAKPTSADTVTRTLLTIDGVEVHGENKGKLVVTAEAANVRVLADLTETIQQIPDVVAVAPVYHEFTEAE